MTNLSTKIHEAVSRLLEDKEETRAVGQLSSGIPPFVELITPGILTLLTTKYWYVAITNRRVIFVRLTSLSKPDFDKTYSVPSCRKTCLSQTPRIQMTKFCLLGGYYVHGRRTC